MSDFQGLDDFRANLQAQGWRIALNGMASAHNSCNWYAWHPKRIDGPECMLNEKPPLLFVWPFVINGDTAHCSAELEINGGVAGAHSISIKAYSLLITEFFDVLPIASRQLIAAWCAAASIKD